MQDHHADVPACRHEPDPLIETARGIAGSDAQAERGNPHHSRPLDEVTQECRADALVTKRRQYRDGELGDFWGYEPVPAFAFGPEAEPCRADVSIVPDGDHAGVR